MSGEAKFTKGEKVVQLAGGVTMTVERVTKAVARNTYLIQCSCKDERGKTRMFKYPEDNLKRVENPDSDAQTMTVMKLGPDHYRVSITGNHWTAVKRRGVWEVLNANGRYLAVTGDRGRRILSAIDAYESGEAIPRAGKG